MRSNHTGTQNLTYWVDGHCISGYSPEDARKEATHLYGYQPEEVRLWTPEDNETRMTLPELNALDTISWHSDEAGGITRTLSDFQHWTGGIEYTIVWHFDTLPTDDEYQDQTQHVRIARGDGLDTRWFLRSLTNPHGRAFPVHGLDHLPIDTAVIDRIRQEPDAFDIGGAPTRRFAVAFYRGDI